jgi:hypothetical protein
MDPDGNFLISQAPTFVPDPGTIFLLGTGVIGLVRIGRKIKK